MVIKICKIQSKEGIWGGHSWQDSWLLAVGWEKILGRVSLGTEVTWGGQIWGHLFMYGGFLLSRSGTSGREMSQRNHAFSSHYPSLTKLGWWLGPTDPLAQPFISSRPMKAQHMSLISLDSQGFIFFLSKLLGLTVSSLWAAITNSDLKLNVPSECPLFPSQ